MKINYIDTLAPNDIPTDVNFGMCVATTSEHLLISAPSSEQTDIASGAVYMYDKEYNFIKYITPDDASDDEYFGTSLITHNDMIYVGAPNNNYSGAVYVFDKNGNQLYKIVPTDISQGDKFGWKICVNDEYLIVSAPNEDVNFIDAGSVYIYDHSGVQLRKLQHNNPAKGDTFGYSLDINDKYILVGTPNKDDGGSSRGSAYMFDFNGTQILKLSGVDTADDDYFGASVSINDNTMVISAPRKPIESIYDGSAYIFDMNGTQLDKLVPLPEDYVGIYGMFCLITDDLLLISAVAVNIDGLEQVGKVYVYDNKRKLIDIVKPTIINENMGFGYSICVDNTDIYMCGLNLCDHYNYIKDNLEKYKLGVTIHGGGSRTYKL